eukprot:3736598-Rhodomonas_salina.4
MPTKVCGWRGGRESARQANSAAAAGVLGGQGAALLAAELRKRGRRALLTHRGPHSPWTSLTLDRALTHLGPHSPWTSLTLDRALTDLGP